MYGRSGNDLVNNLVTGTMKMVNRYYEEGKSIRMKKEQPEHYAVLSSLVEKES